MDSSTPILIFRVASLGDHVLSLPVLHLIARRFPHQQRILITNAPHHPKAPTATSIFQGSNLVHQIIELPHNLSRKPAQVFRLFRKIRQSSAKALIYCSPPCASGKTSWFRNVLFFYLSGIRHFFGVPWHRQGEYLTLPTGMMESEASRLARSLVSLGDAALEQSSSWDLQLTEAESEEARETLLPWQGTPFFAISISSSIQAKDWPVDRWRELMPLLRKAFPSHGFIAVGALKDRDSSQAVLSAWEGVSLNLCGLVSPRQTAALLSHCLIFFGVDSGPMHLAASRDIPCVIVFAARTLPGIWFPRGKNNQILYKQTDCANCGLQVCLKENRRCILSITPEEMVASALRILPR